MGNRSVRPTKVNLANYGAGYYPYYDYEGMENYGSAYQPIERQYPGAYYPGDAPWMTSSRRLGGAGVPGQSGLGQYGNNYPPGFNPALEPGLNGPKVRIIYVPDYVVRGFQNVLQQGGYNSVPGLNPMMSGSGVNPLMGGVPGLNPMMSGSGINPMVGGFGSNPFMGNNMGSVNPFMFGPSGMNPMMGGLSGYAGPQMMPQMYGSSPFFPQMSNPQMPLQQMGSNCCSISLQLPSMGSQIPYPIPCPPPMIQPMMPPSYMRKIVSVSRTKSLESFLSLRKIL